MTASRWPVRAKKIVSTETYPDEYVVEIAPGEHSRVMTFDEAMAEWKVAVEMVPRACIRPWEFVRGPR